MQYVRPMEPIVALENWVHAREGEKFYFYFHLNLFKFGFKEKKSNKTFSRRRPRRFN